MSKLSIFVGFLLVALACYGYFGADEASRSLTAWIPAFVGLPLVVCGWLARRDHLRKMVMHIAVLIAALGALAAGGRGLPKLGALFSDSDDVNRRAVVMVLAMFVLCVVFLVFAVKSFVDVRRKSG